MWWQSCCSCCSFLNTFTQVSLLGNKSECLHTVASLLLGCTHSKEKLSFSRWLLTLPAACPDRHFLKLKLNLLLCAARLFFCCCCCFGFCYCFCFSIGRGLFGLIQSHLSSILIRPSWKEKGKWHLHLASFFLFLGNISLEDQRTSKSKEPSRPALECSQKVSSCCCTSENKINVQAFGTARRQWPRCSVIKGSPWELHALM